MGDISLGATDFARGLERFSGNHYLLGVRFHDGCCGEVHSLSATGRDNGLRTLVANAEMLSDRDLALDMHLRYQRIDALIAVIEQVPSVRVVINHIAESGPLTGAVPNPAWAEAMLKVHNTPIVFCKVSALVQMADAVPAPADVDYYHLTLDVLWDTFGQDRAVYGSNEPQI